MKCFGKHHKSKCGSRIIPFKDYVLNFATRNLDHPQEVYGRWIELFKGLVPQQTLKMQLTSQHQVQLLMMSHLNRKQ